MELILTEIFQEFHLQKTPVLENFKPSCLEFNKAIGKQK